MDAEALIKQSDWWREAQEMPDRHYEESAGFSLADHLQSVHDNLRRLLSPDGLDGYFAEVRQAVVDVGFDLSAMERLIGSRGPSSRHRKDERREGSGR